MTSKISSALARIQNLASDIVNIKIRRKLPTFYYDRVNNVGDKLNYFLLNQVTGRSPYIVKTRIMPHILPVGSILHFSAPSSYIWGSGLIAADKPSNFRYRKILAVRGALTQSELERRTGLTLDVPLGDPALLMPRYYRPKVTATRHSIGIVPHYVDQDLGFLQLTPKPGIKIISVQQNYDTFIDDLTSCDYIVSSSLHGLILADAYEIPNKWVSFSDKLIGGEFKFKDYYSTTSIPSETCISIDAASDLHDLLEGISSRAQVKRYSGSLDDIIRALVSVF